MTDSLMTPCVVGIVGDSGSGKSTLCKGVRALLGPENVAEIRLDDYQRYTREERRNMGITALNPAAHDFTLMEEHLQLLRNGHAVRNRSYDHSNGTFGAIRTLEPREVLLVRGLLGIPSDALRRVYHLTLMIAPEPELLFRWKLRRDMLTRGYTEAEVLTHIAQHMIDAKEHVLPQQNHADLVVHHTVPAVDAPDEEVRTTVRLRGHAATLLRQTGNDAAAGIWSMEEDGADLLLHLPHRPAAEEVSEWVRAQFPTTFHGDGAGTHQNPTGEYTSSAGLLLLQGLVAALVNRLVAAEP